MFYPTSWTEAKESAETTAAKRGHGLVDFREVEDGRGSWVTARCEFCGMTCRYNRIEVHGDCVEHECKTGDGPPALKRMFRL